MKFVPSQQPLGRGRELDEVDAFLEQVPAGLSGLAMTGPAGIGKTTVWAEGVRRAAARGYLVLSARPGQAEQSLSFAGLADLLGPVTQEAFGSLVPVQRRAIDVALLRAEPGPRAGPSPRRCFPCCGRWRTPGRCSSPSMTPSGSTAPPRRAWDSRCAAWSGCRWGCSSRFAPTAVRAQLVNAMTEAGRQR